MRTAARTEATGADAVTVLSLLRTFVRAALARHFATLGVSNWLIRWFGVTVCMRAVQAVMHLPGGRSHLGLLAVVSLCGFQAHQLDLKAGAKPPRRSHGPSLGTL